LQLARKLLPVQRIGDLPSARLPCGFIEAM
jgi:hypothetical protein